MGVRTVAGLIVLLAVGCRMVVHDTPRAGRGRSAAPTAAPTVPDPPPVAVAPGPGPWDEPFAYCAAVGTVDEPDDRYVGPPMTAAVVQGLRQALGLAPDAPSEFLAHSVWRCMGGIVWACTFGANLPCEERADTRRAPTPAMDEFCRARPGADNIPYVVTGRATVWDWRCRGTVPTPEGQIVKADARGFIADIWYPLRAPAPAPTPVRAKAARPPRSH